MYQAAPGGPGAGPTGAGPDAGGAPPPDATNGKKKDVIDAEFEESP
jgi:hypothetical protein